MSHVPGWAAILLAALAFIVLWAIAEVVRDALRPAFRRNHPTEPPAREPRSPAPGPAPPRLLAASDIKETIRTWYCGCIVTWDGRGHSTGHTVCAAHKVLRDLDATTDWEDA